MINNLIPCSNESLYQKIHINTPSSIRAEQRSSQIYELPQYQVTSHRGMAIETPVSRVCTFATINQQGRLEINAEALEIMNSYSKFQVVYCGVYGAKSSGKSTFIDHFMKKDVENQLGFKAEGKISAAQSLIINKIPLPIGSNKKLFFIEYSKGFQSASILQKSQKLLDLLIFVSNSLVVIVNKGQVLKSIVKHIEASAKRLKFDSNYIHFWPENLYIIDNYNNLSRDIGGIGHYFRRTSLILWIKGQSKPLSNFLSDISLTSDAKSFKGITNNWHITKKLLEKLQIEQNLIKDDSLPIQQIFESVYQEMCYQYLLYHQQLYDSTLQQYFTDERPYKIDYLIQSFDKCRETIVTHYKENHIVRDFHEDELEKLQNFIEQRQRLIVEVNRKKSQFQLKKEISSIGTFHHKFPKIEDVETAIGGLRTTHAKFEHAGVDLYAATLYQMIKNVEKGHKKLTKKTQQQSNSTIATLENEIQQSRQLLKNLKSSNNTSLAKMKNGEAKIGQLKDQATRLKKELQLQKKNHKQIFNAKLTLQEKADKLLAIIRQLQEKTRQNQKARRDIQKQFDFNPEVERLQRKLEKLERDKNGEGSKLQSALNSIIQPQVKSQSKINIDNKAKGGPARTK